jgi:hypothetical protein
VCRDGLCFFVVGGFIAPDIVVRRTLFAMNGVLCGPQLRLSYIGFPWCRALITPDVGQRGKKHSKEKGTSVCHD